VYDVKLTPAFNWLLILLVPLTFSCKLVAERPAVQDTQGKINQFLTEQRFEVTEQSLMKGSSTAVRAIKGDCSMLVAEASPDGSLRNLIRRHVTATMDRPFVVFRGHIYHEHPTWLMITQLWWMRLLRKLGISHEEATPIVVAATHSCAAERLPWAQL
jgi:hypothetical protein